MVTITTNTFNKDLDRYISSRRQPTGIMGLFGAKPKRRSFLAPEQKKTAVQIVDEEPGFWKRLFSGTRVKKDEIPEDLTPEEQAKLEQMQQAITNVEQAEREHPEVKRELEEVKGSLIDRFFNMFRFYEHRHKVDREAERLSLLESTLMQERAELRRDLKMIHRWLMRLDEDEMSAFRRSPDFEQYRSLLEKYGVAKKQEQAATAVAKPTQPAFQPTRAEVQQAKPAAEPHTSNAAASAAIMRFAQSAQSHQEKYDPKKDHEYKDIRSLKK